MNYSKYNLTLDQAITISNDPQIPLNSQLRSEAIGVLASAQESFHQERLRRKTYESKRGEINTLQDLYNYLSKKSSKDL